MSKRILSLIIVLLLLVVFSVAQAQETVSGVPRFARTQGQSSAQFSMAGTSPYLGSVPANGFIMSDGRICNPRWGC